jgi:uncharacterized protein
VAGNGRKAGAARAEKALALLEKAVKRNSPAAVAFSGGVDSAVLAAAAFRASPDAAAITMDSDALPRRELRCAREAAREIGIRHFVERLNGQGERFRANRADRCYWCKRRCLALVSAKAKVLGLRSVLEGSNADDLAEHAQGLRAARELGVKSPLAEAGLGKADVRAVARHLGLSVWGKPSSACLASRIAPGQRITRARLWRIEEAEEFLRSEFGLEVVRVRDHGSLARVQAESGEMGRILSPGALRSIAERIKSLGFKHVCIDAEGYVRGR